MGKNKTKKNGKKSKKHAHQDSGLTFVGGFSESKSFRPNGNESKSTISTQSPSADVVPSDVVLSTSSAKPTLSKNVTELRFMRRTQATKIIDSTARTDPNIVPNVQTTTKDQTETQSISNKHNTIATQSDGVDVLENKKTSILSIKWQKELDRTDNIWETTTKCNNANASTIGAPRVSRLVGRRSFGGFVPFLERRYTEEKLRRAALSEQKDIIDDAERLLALKKNRV